MSDQLFDPAPPSAWRNVIHARDLLYELVKRDMKLRYKGSVLGVFWSLLNPLAQLLVFSIIFHTILPLGIPDYTAFLFTGLLAWTWFQTSWVAATTTIVENRNLIKRPGFPAAILPVVTITANLIHFLIALPLLLIVVLVEGAPLRATLWLLPLLIAMQFVLTLGLAYVTAALHVVFRDTQHLVTVFVLLLFYLTPIFYAVETIPARLRPIFALNPLLHIIDGYRALLVRGEWPAPLPWLLVLAGSLAGLLAGMWLFGHISNRFVEEL